MNEFGLIGKDDGFYPEPVPQPIIEIVELDSHTHIDVSDSDVKQSSELQRYVYTQADNDWFDSLGMCDPD